MAEPYLASLSFEIAYVLERLTGARMHHQVSKVGGVGVDVDEQMLSEIERVLANST
jgi:NADH:ubiquinone oxidoreductase subunit D